MNKQLLSFGIVALVTFTVFIGLECKRNALEGPFGKTARCCNRYAKRSTHRRRDHCP